MFNKIVSADEAVAGVQDGMTIMVGGFLGTGSPEVLMDALVRKGVKHLTVIGNDGGLAEGQPAGEFAGKTPRGIGKLLENHMVDHVIMSHVGVNPRLPQVYSGSAGNSGREDQSGSLRTGRSSDTCRSRNTDGDRP